jgi:hypothetical protein
MAFLKRSDTAEALGIGYQIPRNSLALLMIAQLVVVLPHAAHITPWIIAVGLFCGYWRWMVFLGRWDYPQRWIKVLLVVASAIGVGVSGKSAFSLETATGLLIVAFAPAGEMKSRRDAYLVIRVLFHRRCRVSLRSIDRCRAVRRAVDGNRDGGARRLASVAHARAGRDIVADRGRARDAGSAADAGPVPVFSSRRAAVVGAAPRRHSHWHE